MHMSTPRCVSITLLGLSPDVIRTIAIIKPQGTSVVSCALRPAARRTTQSAVPRDPENGDAKLLPRDNN